MSKRKLLELVQQKFVSGWDDPRMPTLAGIRRRGYTPEAVRAFCDRIGVAKRESRVDIALLEFSLREELNRTAPRVMAVLRPLLVTLENFPEGHTEETLAVNNPEDESAGTRKVKLSRQLYIEQDDFMEQPVPKYFRLAPGREVRLKHAYFIRCERVIKDAAGRVVELRCTYDPATSGGSAPDGRKVKGTLHWVSADHAITAEVRLYDHLFSRPDPEDVEEGATYLDHLNPNSLDVLSECKLEATLASARPGDRFQFLRHGYFCIDAVDSRPERMVFNRTVSLRDSWAKIAGSD
jgi:glutaminyl-tRNA synthetase